MTWSIAVHGHGSPTNDKTATIDVLLREFVDDIKSAGYQISNATCNADGKTTDALAPERADTEAETPPEGGPSPADAPREDDKG